jgi:hypothetical protein
VLLNFPKQAGGYVKDEAANLVAMRNVRAVLDASNRLANISVQIVERFSCPFWLLANFGADAFLEVIVGESEHSTIGVMDQDDFFGTEQALADCQGSDFICGNHATGITNYVGLPLA